MNKKLSVFLIILLLLVGGVAAFFTLKLDKPILEAKVKQGIANMQSRAEAEGRSLQVTYESMDVQGNWFARQSVLNNVTLTTRSGGRQIELSTPKVLYIPKNITLTSYRVEIPAGIQIKENGNPSGNLTYDSPLAFAADKQQGDTVTTFDLPLQLTYTSEAVPSQPVQVSFGSKPVITQRNDASGMPLESHGEAQNIKITGPQGEASVAQVTVDMKNMLVGTGPQHDVSYVIAMKDIALPVGVNPYGPFNFTLNANYIGDMPKDMQMPAFGGFQPEEFQVKLNELSLIAKDFGITLKADIMVSKTDPMPTGTGNLHVENFDFIIQELLNTQAITQEDLAKLEPILIKATGKPLAESKHLDLAFERKQGDVLHVGNATGEELLLMAMPLFAGPQQAAETPSAQEETPAPEKAAAPAKTAPAAKPAVPSPTPPAAAIPAPVMPVTPAPVVPVPNASGIPSPVPPTTKAKEASPAAAAPVAPPAPPAAPAPTPPAVPATE